MRISDWSSDVCSSDLWLVPSLFDLPSRLGPPREGEDLGAWYVRLAGEMTADDWKRYAETLNKTAAELKPHGLRIAHRSEERRVGKEVSVRVDLGGRRIITKKIKKKKTKQSNKLITYT